MSNSQEESVRLFHAMDYGQTPSLITQCLDYAMSVFSLAMKHGTVETFDQLCKLHSMSDSQEESVRLFRAMGYGQTPSLGLSQY